MTARDHNRLLGIFFAIHTAYLALIYGLVLLIYGGIGAVISAGGKDEDRFAGFIILAAVVVAFCLMLVIVVPQAMAAFKLLKNRGNARFWAIFGAIVALLSFPFGTALGVYALVFLFGEQGKQFYSGNRDSLPPPPPNSWR